MTARNRKNNGIVVRREQTAFAASVKAEVGAIAGLDTGMEHRYRFPRLGKIHLGTKVQKTRGNQIIEYPASTDYFVLPEQLLNDEKFRTALEQLGEDPQRPRKLPIRLVSNAIADNIKSSLDYYGANRGLKCRSWDGLTAQRVNEHGEIETCTCRNVECPDYQNKNCQCITRLRFMLPDASGIGVWQIDTRSINNRINLPCEMQIIRAAVGRLAGLDLLLTLEPEERVVTIKNSSAPNKITVHLLHIRTRLTLRELEEAAKHIDWDVDVAEVEDVDTSYDEIVMGEPPAEEPEEPEPENQISRSDMLALIRSRLADRGWTKSHLPPSLCAAIGADEPVEVEVLTIEQCMTLLEYMDRREQKQNGSEQ